MLDFVEITMQDVTDIMVANDPDDKDVILSDGVTERLLSKAMEGLANDCQYGSITESNVHVCIVGNYVVLTDIHGFTYGFYINNIEGFISAIDEWYANNETDVIENDCQ